MAPISPTGRTIALIGRRNAHPLTILLLALAVALGGCLSPPAMHRAVIEYDKTMSQVEGELLLLNIARARNGSPVHFTSLANVAATFDFRVNGGVGGQLVENTGSPDFVRNLLSLNFGSSVSENPTMSIIPIQGEEFTKRIMTPLDAAKFGFLVRQGLEPAIILRLMARSIEIDEGETATVHLNMPHREEEYREFRRRILHLSALALARQLHVTTVVYEEPWPLPADHPLTAQALGQGYRWTEDADGEPRLTIRRTGRPVVTNYDLIRLSNRERRRLFERSERLSQEYMLVDIRPDHPGGEYSWQGRVMFRSFRNILVFLGRGIEAEAELHVEKDPRTGPVLWNPVQTLTIQEGLSRPQDALFAVEYEGRFYFLRREHEGHRRRWSWNQQAFAILHQLFQMTVSKINQLGALPITIAK